MRLIYELRVDYVTNDTGLQPTKLRVSFEWLLGTIVGLSLK